jgi:arylsulfatase A-like enzyme
MMVRVLAQAIAVFGALVGGKIWLVRRQADAASLSPWMLGAVAQDVLVAVVLVGFLVLTALPGRPILRRVGETVVALTLVANAFLLLVARELNGLAVLDADTPLSVASLAAIVEDHGSAKRWLALAAIVGALWGLPHLAARGARAFTWMVPLARRGGAAALLAAGLVGTAASSARRSADDLDLASLRQNPVVHYVAGSFVRRGFADVERPPAADPDALARSLGPPAAIAGLRESEAALEALAGARFDVVLAVLESAGMTAFDLEGPPSERHPFLSRARDRAVLFRRYSTPAPHSRTALTAMFCSTYRLPVGLADDSRRPLDRCRPLPRLLEAGGVRTALFQSTYAGDWIEGEFFERLGFGVVKDASRILTERAAAGRPVASRNGILQERETVAELLGWVGERCARREPFFGVYYSWVAHAPYPAEHAEVEPFSPALPSRERHRRLVRTLDAQLDRIADALARGSCGRPAVLLVTGDHGEAFGEHPGNRYHVMQLYEENVRVPLLAIAPGLEGRVVDRVASHVDLAPTVLDLALGPGAVRAAAAPSAPGHPGRPYQGRSLLRPGGPRPTFSVTLQGGGQAAIRFGQFKLIATPTAARLFDTDADPGETRDLSARHPELAAALRDALGSWAAFQVAWEAGVADDADRLSAGGGGPTKTSRR